VKHNICGVVVSALLIAAPLSAANAADPKYKVPAPPPAPIFTWTGFYVGGQIGYQWGTVTRAAYFADGAFNALMPPISAHGVVGGAHGGYNYQMNQFVVGLEGDIAGTGLSGGGLDANGGIYAAGHVPLEGSIRGRIGFAWDRAMLYATGGVAFATVSSYATNLTNGLTDNFKNGLVGWTIGTGLEYAVDKNWSIRTEYRYTDYGNFDAIQTNSTAGIPGGPINSHQLLTANKVEVGFSYKFD
jgi:outer membrane immunogenic protein